MKYLADGGKRKERGWLRRSEAELRSISIFCEDGRPRSHLNEDENQILVEIKRELDRVQEIHVSPGSRHMADLAHAYGVSLSKVKQCVGRYVANNFSTARKPNPQKGRTVFNLERKRKEVYTPRNFSRRLSAFFRPT